MTRVSSTVGPVVQTMVPSATAPASCTMRFEMFDLLHGDRDLSLDDTIRLTITTIERALCHPTRRRR